MGRRPLPSSRQGAGAVERATRRHGIGDPPHAAPGAATEPSVERATRRRGVGDVPHVALGVAAEPSVDQAS